MFIICRASRPAGPDGITASLLRRLLAPGTRLIAADLVLQRAAVRKYAGGRGPGTSGRHRAFSVTAGIAVPRSAFRPPPRVDSAVLVVRRR